ncbi:MAG: enoyl-CoA hydratase/isomerase family protein [Desulfobulbus sp.]|jgi:enoyl-CoA hydratase|uniref:enoyl-CoA hydratase/isomerase family protein n=1 Tax=Desulfobulbus sp. TaxID=895 RepID=UPI00284F6D13|nr:enoyl-CoA hydratase-related protein [Desulfobulbus sp.]MDR2550793.1 enoyl-CoA hydratase/isomerase family protein [Desulfobulbus sp.]
MKYKTISLRKENGLAILTLQRPENLHALNSQMLGELGAALADIEREERLGGVILTGGSQCFSAGFDVGEISGFAAVADMRRFFRESHAVFERLEELEKPVIAAIAGLCLGGGCELALACDLRIAADNASFGQPEIKIGMIPGGGATQRLPRLIGMTKAKELLLTGDYVDASEAARIGLVNKVVPAASLLEAARAMANKILQHSRCAVKAAKLAVNGGAHMDIKSGIAHEARCLDVLFATHEQHEGITAFMEKRRPVFKQP